MLEIRERRKASTFFSRVSIKDETEHQFNLIKFGLGIITRDRPSLFFPPILGLPGSPTSLLLLLLLRGSSFATLFVPARFLPPRPSSLFLRAFAVGRVGGCGRGAPPSSILGHGWDSLQLLSTSLFHLAVQSLQMVYSGRIILIMIIKQFDQII